MTRWPELGGTLAMIACSAFASPGQLAPARVAATHIAAGQAPGSRGTAADAHLITLSGMGHVRLGMTLDDARRTLPGAAFRRTSDGDGVALVEIALAPHDSLVVWAGEDEPANPIDWSERIVTIETFSAAFHTRQGIHPGSLVVDAARFVGPVREIVTGEIESREYVTFARQPAALTFRLNHTGIYQPGQRRTTSFAPGAKISSITISSQ